MQSIASLCQSTRARSPSICSAAYLLKPEAPSEGQKRNSFTSLQTSIVESRPFQLLEIGARSATIAVYCVVTIGLGYVWVSLPIEAVPRNWRYGQL
jgi:hypothetical protein